MLFVTADSAAGSSVSDRSGTSSQLCRCVWHAAIPTPRAICRPEHVIMKVNLLNTKIQYYLIKGQGHVLNNVVHT